MRWHYTVSQLTKHAKEKKNATHKGNKLKVAQQKIVDRIFFFFTKRHCVKNLQASSSSDTEDVHSPCQQRAVWSQQLLHHLCLGELDTGAAVSADWSSARLLWVPGTLVPINKQTENLFFCSADKGQLERSHMSTRFPGDSLLKPNKWLNNQRRPGPDNVQTVRPLWRP